MVVYIFVRTYSSLVAPFFSFGENIGTCEQYPVTLAERRGVEMTQISFDCAT